VGALLAGRGEATMLRRLRMEECEQPQASTVHYWLGHRRPI
jgi:hypothetical protein